MTKHKVLKDCRGTFKFKEFISNERKKTIEKHPQAREFFILKKCPGGYKWYVKTVRGDGIPISTIKNGR